jgi:cytoskeletal protein RodZ
MPKESQKTQKSEREFIYSIISTLKMIWMYSLTYSEEVTHDPFEDSSETEKNRPSKEEDTNNTSKTAGTSKAHQDHRKGKGRDDKPRETHRHGVGESFDIVAMAGSLGCEVKLLEKLW